MQHAEQVERPVEQQASRRSWRIGQTQPVQVVFMAYRNTLQADALKLDVSRAGPTWWR